MTLDSPEVRQRLMDFDLTGLFVGHLGWDRPGASLLPVAIDGQDYSLRAVAEKRGVQVFECMPVPPDRATRQKVERQVARSAREHLIVFSDPDRGHQIWQWVARHADKPDALREHPYFTSQAPDRLLQRLEELRIPIAEDEEIGLTLVIEKLRKGFDKDKVTKRFYDRFKKEHQQFLAFIQGIQAKGDREWYASLMLNRLMFIYFIQKKGFLDGNRDYLRDRLRRVQAERGQGTFLSFYRDFLTRLFHEGLAAPEQDRAADLDDLLGRVPYLNGGLFDQHQLEKQNPDLEIPDDAFEALFDFFDEFDWTLDDRPLGSGKEINPDVLGYIFEKYINQKQMGAYYTKEDITEYISKNTIVPFLLDSASRDCAIAFKPDGSVWRLLQESPDAYIYPSVRHGVDEPLPPDIEAGVDDVSQRQDWNRAALPAFALPTETWREHIARRQRCLEVRAKLAAGEVTQVNDLVTLNLDIHQFIQDAIERCEGPELLRALFYKGIEKVTVLDPTCGSGAFLFAALKILQPLYLACLERMETFVSDLDVTEPGSKKMPDFRHTLAQVALHPNREYFILKSIILNNLYGVDIMEEAVEICKLRLFLTLAAQVHTYDQIQPLPDIDFNIRAGNTLVGFATYDDATEVPRLDLDGMLPRVKEGAELAARAFERFRQMQDHQGVDRSAFREAKVDLRERLGSLGLELDQHLAIQYGVEPTDSAAFASWRSRHQPFHWFIAFYDIIQRGGFDAIIGNPPYVEYSRVRHLYRVHDISCVTAGNLYAFVVERCTRIQSSGSYIGMILQLSAFCTPRMEPFQDVWFGNMQSSWLSFFDDRPGKLFDGLEHIRAVVALGTQGADGASRVMTTRYNKFATEQRPHLFDALAYKQSAVARHESSVLKLSTNTEESIVTKLWSQPGKLGDYLSGGHEDHFVFYGYGYGYWGKILNFKSAFIGENSEASTGDKYLYLNDPNLRDVIVALLNSSLFYWFYVNYSDGHNFTKHVISAIPFSRPSVEVEERLITLSRLLMADLRRNASMRTARYKTTGEVSYQEFAPRLSKALIDEIDSVLGDHYGFNVEELEYIINYDIKYRMGADANEE